MTAFREWWSTLVQRFLTALSELWGRFVLGVTETWDIRIFVFGAGAVVVIGLIMMFRKKA